jgi:hypothetical protein
LEKKLDALDRSSGCLCDSTGDAAGGKVFKEVHLKKHKQGGERMRHDD